jgi:hypothetical protein
MLSTGYWDLGPRVLCALPTSGAIIGPLNRYTLNAMQSARQEMG